MYGKIDKEHVREHATRQIVCRRGTARSRQIAKGSGPLTMLRKAMRRCLSNRRLPPTVMQALSFNYRMGAKMTRITEASDFIIEILGKMTGQRPKPSLWHNVERFLLGVIIFLLLGALAVRIVTWVAAL